MKKLMTMLAMILTVTLTQAQQINSINGTATLAATDTILCMESLPGGDLFFGTSGTGGNTAQFSRVDGSNTIDSIWNATRIPVMGLYPTNKIAFYITSNSGIFYYNGSNVIIQPWQISTTSTHEINAIRPIISTHSLVGGNFSFYDNGGPLKYDMAYGTPSSSYLYDWNTPLLTATSICNDMTKNNSNDTVYACGKFDGTFGTTSIMRYVGTGRNPLYTAPAGGIITEIELYHDSLFFIISPSPYIYRVSKNGGTATVVSTTIFGIKDMEVHDDQLFFGGLSLISYNDGIWTTYIPNGQINSGGSIFTLASHNSSLYFGGNFLSINGNNNYRKLCKLDLITSISEDIKNIETHVTITGDKFTSDTEWTIYDMSGRVVMNGGPGTYSLKNTGLYIISTKYGSKKYFNK